MISSELGRSIQGAFRVYLLRRDKLRRGELCGNKGLLGAGAYGWSGLPEGELMGLFHLIWLYREWVRPRARLGRKWIEKEGELTRPLVAKPSQAHPHCSGHRRSSPSRSRNMRKTGWRLAVG